MPDILYHFSVPFITLHRFLISLAQYIVSLVFLWTRYRLCSWVLKVDPNDCEQSPRIITGRGAGNFSANDEKQLSNPKEITLISKEHACFKRLHGIKPSAQCCKNLAPIHIYKFHLAKNCLFRPHV